METQGPFHSSARIIRSSHTKHPCFPHHPCKHNDTNPNIRGRMSAQEGYLLSSGVLLRCL